MDIAYWNKILKEHGYKSVEEYVKLWNEGGKNQIDLNAEVEKVDIKKFLKDHGRGLNKQMRTFVFTIHKPFMYYDSIEEIENILKSWKGVKRSIFSLEVAKGGKTLHIQGYVNMKNSATKASIIRRFKNTDMYIESAKGTDLDSFVYIGKDEGIEKKIISTVGDWNIDRLQRKDLNVSEFVDFVYDNDVPVTLANIDKYCGSYRKNPGPTTLMKISNLLNIRRKAERISNVKPIETMTIFGNSGNGKSLLSEWLFDQIDLNMELIFKKAAADKASENDWWSTDNILQTQAFFTEVDVTFPKKRYLLSFLDKKDPLSVKGRDGIINNFDHLVINATSTSMRYIYNATQDKKSFTEIYRRLLKGHFIYVEANPEWSKRDLAHLSNEEMMDQYPPVIYLLDTKAAKALGAGTSMLYKDEYNIKDKNDFKLMNEFRISNRSSNNLMDYIKYKDNEPIDTKKPLYLHELVSGNPMKTIVESIKIITKEDVLKLYIDQIKNTKMKNLLK